MKRNLCVSAFFALVLVPDWSAACGPGGMPGYEGTYYAPVYYAAPPAYHQPVYVQPVYVQPCIPAAPPMFPPPRVEQSKGKPASGLTEKPRPIARPTPAKPPEVEPVRPASGMDNPPARPADVAKPQAAPAAPAPAAPAPAPKPEPEQPKNDAPKLPAIELPKTSDPKLPAIELPKSPEPGPSLTLPPKPGAEPKLPSLELPGGNAVPSAAPAPDSLIPPPNIPAPKDQNLLPPLTLPPDTPVSPAPPKSVEVKSSPLGTAARELKVSVFPAAGTVAANGLRKVGFYNHTNRDLSLTLEGRTVTLPAMSYLHAQLPPTFTWKCGSKPTTKATVPEDASGLDVLIRE